MKKAVKKLINKKEKNTEWNECCNKNHYHNNVGGAVYGLGFVGALIYYISTASSFWMGVLGILKAIVWPAFAVYGLLKFLGM